MDQPGYRRRTLEKDAGEGYQNKIRKMLEWEPQEAHATISRRGYTLEEPIPEKDTGEGFRRKIPEKDTRGGYRRKIPD